MAELTFSDLNLHDSSVLGLNLTLDRNEHESFEIFLRYIENYETLRTSRRRMAFTDCREVRIEGHLGFVRGNSILSGEVIEHSDLLAQTYSAWEKLWPRRAWKHFRLLTNTRTKIDVVAGGFEFEDADK
jgi:hypothetical protein